MRKRERGREGGRSAKLGTEQKSAGLALPRGEKEKKSHFSPKKKKKKEKKKKKKRKKKKRWQKKNDASEKCEFN